MSGKCRDCEFCFPHDEFGWICAGDNYGEDISKSLDIEKPCYSESLEAFIKRSKQEEVVFLPGIKLAQLKIDGRRVIFLVDKEGKKIRIKFSTAKKIFGEIKILKLQSQEEYLLDTVFNNELFNGGSYIVVK